MDAAIKWRREWIVFRAAVKGFLHIGSSQWSKCQLIHGLRGGAAVVENVTRVVQQLDALPPRHHRRGEAWGGRRKGVRVSVHGNATWLLIGSV